MGHNRSIVEADAGGSPCRASKRQRRELPEPAEVVDTTERVREGMKLKRAVWVASRAEDLDLIAELDTLRALQGDHRLVVRDRVGSGRSELLRARFRQVISADRSVKLLAFDQLLEVLASPARDDLFIGVAIDPEDRSVVLFRGSLEPIIVPMSFFGISPARDPSDLPEFEVTEFGQGLRVGDKEASTDAILYAFDEVYRRRKKELRIEQDPTFGGALRRLRILRRLSRSDFEGVSAKEIARIERGEVERPHRKTIELLAQQLDVQPEEITSY